MTLTRALTTEQNRLLLSLPTSILKKELKSFDDEQIKKIVQRITFEYVMFGKSDLAIKIRDTVIELPKEDRVNVLYSEEVQHQTQLQSLMYACWNLKFDNNDGPILNAMRKSLLHVREAFCKIQDASTMQSILYKELSLVIDQRVFMCSMNQLVLASIHIVEPVN